MLHPDVTGMMVDPRCPGPGEHSTAATQRNNGSVAVWRYYLMLRAA
jgi:hypothetical protein